MDRLRDKVYAHVLGRQRRQHRELLRKVVLDLRHVSVLLEFLDLLLLKLRLLQVITV